MDVDQQRRVARNEVRFRELNEMMKEAVDGIRGADDDRSFEILCECALEDCMEMVEVLPGQYEAVRATPTRFIVMAQHIQPEVERVVEEHGKYWVVEKNGVGADVARQRS
ncbi:MAG: hypothetical protein JWM90_2899 [Thermoleophilia bacterium]|nr:hypothetical protein [Thermoleophilia bacterium]